MAGGNVAVALLAIRFRDAMPMRTAQVLAVLGLAFFLLRLAGNSWSLAIAADDQAERQRRKDPARVPQPHAEKDGAADAEQDQKPAAEIAVLGQEPVADAAVPHHDEIEERRDRDRH